MQNHLTIKERLRFIPIFATALMIAVGIFLYLSRSGTDYTLAAGIIILLLALILIAVSIVIPNTIQKEIETLRDGFETLNRSESAAHRLSVIGNDQIGVIS